MSIPFIDFSSQRESELNIEILTIEALKKGTSASELSKPHRANFFRLIGITAGRTSPVIDFIQHHATVRHWLLVRPGQVLQYDFTHQWTGWLLVFRAESLGASSRSHEAPDLTLLGRIERFQNQWVLTEQQLNCMRRALKLIYSDARLSVNSETRNALMQHHLATLLLRLSIWQDVASIDAPPANAALDHFKRFRQLVEKDFKSAHSVTHYAQILGMSEKNLSRASMAGAGINAKTYISQRVVLEAKRLLVHTTRSVQSIAIELGFEDTANFNKYFKRMSAGTPGDFRVSQSGSMR